MIRLLLILLVVLSVVLSLCIVGAKIIGMTQSPSPILAFLSDRDKNDLSRPNDVIVMDVARGITLNITRQLAGSAGGPLTWNNNGDLVFINHTLNDVEVYIWNDEGLTNVSQNPATTDQTPMWSEDGRLAFITYRDDRWRVAVWDAGIVTTLDMAVLNSTIPTWSSDGRLAFIVPNLESSVQQVFTAVDLYIWDGTTSTSIDSVDGLSQMSWSDDGRLAYNALNNATLWDVFIWDGTAHFDVMPDAHGDFSGVWSSDGQLAFGSNRSGDSEIYVWDDGTITNISQDPFEDYSPTWSDDGRMAFSSNRTGDAEIFVWDGTTITNISQNTAFDFNPVWSPNGWLSFESNRDGNNEIYLWNGTTVRNISQSAAYDLMPTWWLPSS